MSVPSATLPYPFFYPLLYKRVRGSTINCHLSLSLSLYSINYYYYYFVTLPGEALAFVKNRTTVKVGVNWSIDARIVVKLEDIAISRKAKLSPIVQEVLSLGIQSYEVAETKRICAEMKKDEMVVARQFAARPVVPK